MTEKVKIAMEEVEEIKKAAVHFKDSIANRLKDMHVEMRDWSFGVENNEEGVAIDVKLKVLIKQKAKVTAV